MERSRERGRDRERDRERESERERERAEARGVDNGEVEKRKANRICLFSRFFI